MKFIIGIAIALLCVSSSVTSNTYIGKWKITGGSIIEIYKEGDHFYGKIDKRAEKPLSNFNGLDNKNPKKELQNRPLLGMVILDNLSYQDGVLSGGTIYNADSGKSYAVKVWINQDDTNLCYIRAYKSILFKTFKAVRVIN
ncbi:DUF2147 domain-containing protein [Aquimarina sp. AD10]|uniref:DUF2147 domain-containing protein n=1 Tax=Aquimarina aggregata TaxID=1642818 RepID=A0A163CQP6_9FLAO|nr:MULTISPECIES: DUF2147 domain-containing protein [Aquimarina]AXT59336.1 DUF2147 domain-containing protein [Aquimarina sp. AD10]KZS42665.1 hypothetical protein AWE51_04240 [Aquimarina aggregata]RKM95158.1 DUF2147 domain-containing protein [Aquimarina sp. AD10]